jgi:hypothetical protein
MMWKRPSKVELPDRPPEQADYRVAWRCALCHRTDLHGGVRMKSKTKAVAGRCYWCDCGPVEAYYGVSRRAGILD